MSFKVGDMLRATDGRRGCWCVAGFENRTVGYAGNQKEVAIQYVQTVIKPDGTAPKTARPFIFYTGRTGLTILKKSWVLQQREKELAYWDELFKLAHDDIEEKR